jgi:diguanylate cyclase (GGDEF)-like protein
MWPRDDLAALARKAVALGIGVCAPVLLVIWLVDGRHDPWIRLGYPPLSAALAAFAWVLLRRPAWAGRAAVVTLVGLELWWIALIVGRTGEAPDAAAAWISLAPTPLFDVVVCLVVGFLFQRTRTALIHGGTYAVAVTGTLTWAMLRLDGGEAFLGPALRYGLYLAVVLLLLLVLSRAKERVAAAVADAARADATASRMRDMAYLDELTGIANRRRLIEELGHQAGLVGTDRPVAVVYFDLDRFKQLNDTRGHEVGDRVLRHVAEVADRLVRDGDLLARLGGEEFVVVAPDTDHRQAVQLAERLREALPVELSVTVGSAVTASFGVTELRQGEDAATVLRRVDALMYRAKAGGRDRVCVDEPSG